jgi:tetratricopeptide (TPR) repeat protein
MDTLSLLILLVTLVALAASIVLPSTHHGGTRYRPASPQGGDLDTVDMQLQLQNGTPIATIADTEQDLRQRSPRLKLLVVFVCVVVIGLVGLAALLNEWRTARAPTRFVVIVAPFADGSSGRAGASVAAELTKLLADQLWGEATVTTTDRRPADAGEALALAQREGADLLIWGDLEPGALLDSPSLRPRLVYTPSGPYAPNAWLGYQGRFAMPRHFTLTREPINGQAVLTPLLLALVHYAAGEADQAELQLSRLLSDYPALSGTLPRVIRGNIYWARGFYAEAAAEYRLALVEPGDDPALLMNNLAAILREGNDPAVLEVLADAVRLLDGRDLGELRANLGALALRDRRYAAAAVELEQAQNLLPASTTLLLDLATAYRETGRLNDARTALAAAEAVLPQDEQLVPSRFRTLNRQRLQAHLREQQALLDLALQLRAEGPIVWELEVAPPQSATRVRPIRDQLSSAIELSDQVVKHWRSIAASDGARLPDTDLLASGQAERTELQRDRQRYYLALVTVELERKELRRNDPGFLSSLFATGPDEPESLTILNDLAIRQPTAIAILTALGRAALNADQLDRAEGQYALLVNLVPQLPEGFFGQGQVAASRGDLPRAIELYNRALERDTNFFPARVMLARLAEERGDWTVAIVQRRALLAIRPGPPSLIALAQDLRESGPDGWSEAEQLLLPLRTTSPDAAIELGRLYNDADRGDVAVGVYRDAVALDTSSATASFELGETLVRQDDYLGAEGALREALRRDPTHLEARLALAELYQGPLGDLKRAEREFQTALQQGVDDPVWLERIGDAALANGNAEQARSIYTRALEQRPDSATLYHKIGLAQAARNQLDTAAQTQLRAIELATTMENPAGQDLQAAALVSLGDVRRLQGRSDEASEAYDAALRLDPARVEAQIGRGQLAVGEANWSVAHGYFATAAAMPTGVTNPEAQFWLAESLLRRNDFTEATIFYERALELRAIFPEVYLGMAQVDYAQRNLDAALRNIELALKQRPTYAEAFLFKGKLLQEQGRDSEALVAYDRSIAANGRIAESHYRRGVLRIQSGDYDLAIRDLNRAATLQANFPEAAYWLGRAYYAQGRLEAALRAFRQAISYNANYAEAILYTGLVAEDLGYTAEAITAYQTVIQIDAQSEQAKRARLQLDRLT